MAFVRADVKNIVHLYNSTQAERSWHLLHLDVGTLAIANWYRPPSSALEHIASLQEELSGLKHEVIGFILLGDMNIHHQRWLFRSNANTLEGSTLKEICDDFALQEIVRQPTRGEYLLDLCLTVLEDSKCVTLPEIPDHKVCCSV